MAQHKVSMPASRIDVRQELEEARLGGFHLRLGILISLILLFDGYDLYNSAYIVHYVTGPWGLSPTRIGIMLSSGLAGFAAGSAISGLLGDRFGRRKILLLGCWGSGVMSLAIAVFADNLALYIALRVTMGLALGLLMPLAVTYINEIAPTRSSNVFTSLFFSLGWVSGSSSAGLIAAWLTPRFGWQSLYYVGGISLVFALAIQLWLPESPRFLASRGRWDEVKSLLYRLRPERAAAYDVGEFAAAGTVSHRSPLGRLLTHEYRLRTLSFWAAGALSLFSAYGLSGWLPTIMLKRGENLSSSFAYGSLFAGMAVAGGLISGFIADRVGDRRRVIALSYLLGAAMVALLAWATDRTTTLIAVAGAGAFVVGSQIVLNNLVATAYPTEMRGTGVGLFLGLSRVGAMFGPAVAGILQQWSGGPGIMFVAIGIALLTTATLILTIGPSQPHVVVTNAH
ncbi:MFS transporter [Paraburkholderia megapolitana]|uniref:MFS transporter, AAHS family, 4-hydroxybenzoate transporter n=1 Tax=Paraburkholderia megapolitana TaxID=420953 RepID=A0A1I3UDR1_9BURK|nr:MFS transporter [Paraburkholderia megapolitana]QDQ83554.1 MFS transporter [Paraburkholderia megapolitana]SFJ81015.1 MFS transporter, AAHS family, 4-hydroxybenzoate transporter [Paraburkholderia megapolitana]